MLIGLCMNANRNLIAAHNRRKREMERIEREKEQYEQMQNEQEEATDTKH